GGQRQRAGRVGQPQRVVAVGPVEVDAAGGQRVAVGEVQDDRVVAGVAGDEDGAEGGLADGQVGLPGHRGVVFEELAELAAGVEADGVGAVARAAGRGNGQAAGRGDGGGGRVGFQYLAIGAVVVAVGAVGPGGVEGAADEPQPRVVAVVVAGEVGLADVGR